MTIEQKYTKIDSEIFRSGKFVDNYFLAVGINKDYNTVNLIITNDLERKVVYRQTMSDTPENRQKIEDAFKRLDSNEKIENIIHFKKPTDIRR